MIKFNKKELKYIKNEFKNAITKVNNTHGAELFEYVRSVGAESIDSAIAVVELDDINDVNINEELNKICADATWWCTSMWVFGQSGCDTSEEVRQYIDIPEFGSIFEKIISDDMED